ncbi:MAG: ABC transporter ATP-binding protein [Firmicutes bacterium]|nr:ABC transporter ATP-binding protein [Bacillota bacterium]
MVYVDTILTVDNLHINFYTNNRCNEAVRGVSFQLKKGRTLCLVGESGCGKSVTASSIMRLLPPLSRIEEGRIIYHSEQGDIHLHELAANGPEIRSIRGAEIAMIFQDPMTALNPVYTVGFQIREAFLYHTKMAKAAMQQKAIELLRSMRIPAPEQRVNEYIHQYSGGMRQRAMIAMAMSCNPKILIADEPTTALDVTVQAQIFDLMNDLQKKHNAAILLITHDMGVVAELAHDVVVMYMGVAVENGPVEEVLTKPAHPYTSALLKSIPVLGQSRSKKLEPIRGSTPDPYNRPQGCQFRPRCDFATEKCLQEPEACSVGENHTVKCWHWEKVLANA